MTYYQWHQQAEPFETISYNHGFCERTLYRMFGQTVFLETVFPHGLAGITRSYVKAVEFCIPALHPIMLVALRHNAYWEQGYYAQNGFGWPVWTNDTEDTGLARCWAFLQECQKLHKAADKTPCCAATG